MPHTNLDPNVHSALSKTHRWTFYFASCVKLLPRGLTMYVLFGVRIGQNSSSNLIRLLHRVMPEARIQTLGHARHALQFKNKGEWDDVYHTMMSPRQKCQTHYQYYRRSPTVKTKNKQRLQHPHASPISYVHMCHLQSNPVLRVSVSVLSHVFPDLDSEDHGSDLDRCRLVY